LSVWDPAFFCNTNLKHTPETRSLRLIALVMVILLQQARWLLNLNCVCAIVVFFLFFLIGVVFDITGEYK